MTLLVLILIELFILYLLSNRLSSYFYNFLNQIIGNKQISGYLFAFVFLPGTTLHELSHYLAARLLLVKTGKIILSPKLDKDRIKLGSVLVERTDFFRLFLIGIAPVLTGVAMIFAIIYFSARSNLLDNVWILIITGYIVFTIGNTMFSSKKDMASAGKLAIFVVIISGAFYIYNSEIFLKSVLSLLNKPILLNIFEHTAMYLLIPIFIDAVIVAVFKLFYK